MSESISTPRKRLALDTDWLTALNAVLGAIVCAAIGTGLAWSTLHGSVRPGRASWNTPIFAALLIYIAVKGESGKLFKTSVLVFAIGPISGTVLWIARASDQTLLANAVFVRWIYVMLCFACCIYTIYWFKTKLVRV